MLNPHFRDILSAFTDAKVEFLLVGAHALAAHGLVRATSDIDLWVHRTPENAARVQQALLRFGAPREQVKLEDFLEPRMVVQLGVPPFRVDIMTDISGVEWNDAWEQRIATDLDGIQISVLSRTHVLANKRASNRPKDQEDVRLLEEPPSRP